MKTIEERAKEIKDEFGLAGLEDDLNEQVWDTTWGEIINLVERAYVKGATEQRAKDIEKACEWLLKNGFADEDTPDTFVCFKSGYIWDFRKAMEE